MEPVTVEALKRVAALQGYAWSDSDLEAIRPAVERILSQLEKFAALALNETEPAIQFEMF
ncbi:MAG: hypothetical protein ACE5JD_07950 [Candidatus Methylomirabilia bacterium]